MLQWVISGGCMARFRQEKSTRCGAKVLSERVSYLFVCLFVCLFV